MWGDGSDGVAVVTAILIAAFLLWLFWPEKTKWHPFGGVFTRDRKTGAITMALTLPTKKSARKRKR